MKPLPAWMRQNIRKVAIVGGAPSRQYAPYDDPSWEIWGLGTDRHRLPRADRWFEMHSVPQLIRYYDKIRGGKYAAHIRFLRQLKCPVYMQQVHPAIPNSVVYPLDAVLKDCGRCFSSSVSYMLGLAIHERFDAIGMWGVNMTSKQEYTHQWAGVQYLLALARERGIHVYLPDDCPITIPPKAILPVTKVLYGYDWDHPDAWWNKERHTKEKEKERRKRAGTRKKAKKKAKVKARKRAKARAQARARAIAKARASAAARAKARRARERAKAKARARARARAKARARARGRMRAKARIAARTRARTRARVRANSRRPRRRQVRATPRRGRRR